MDNISDDKRHPRGALPALELMLGALLLGIVLLSAVLYYRSVRVQRFLEPALAMSNPRVEFAEGVRALFRGTFGANEIPGVFISGESVFIDMGHMAVSEVHGRSSGPRTIDLLGTVLTAILESPALRNHFDLILVSSFFPLDPGKDSSFLQGRKQGQQQSERLLEKLFSLQPDLLRKYGGYFVPASLPVRPGENIARFIELRFVPAGRQHIRVLQELQDYSR